MDAKDIIGLLKQHHHHHHQSPLWYPLHEATCFSGRIAQLVFKVWRTHFSVQTKLLIRVQDESVSFPTPRLTGGVGGRAWQRYVGTSESTWLACKGMAAFRTNRMFIQANQSRLFFLHWKYSANQLWSHISCSYPVSASVPCIIQLKGCVCDWRADTALSSILLYIYIFFYLSLSCSVFIRIPLDCHRPAHPFNSHSMNIWRWT